MSRVDKLWKEKSSSILDEYLHKRGLKRKPVAKDGCCLFRAVAEQAWLTQASHMDLRRLCATHIKKRESKFTEFLTIPINDYCWKLSNCLLWGGEMELVALSEVLNRVIHVFQEQNQRVTFKEFSSAKRNAEIPIMLAYIGNNHYDIVWRISQEQNAAFCQSIIYDILFDKVLKNTMSTKDRERALTLKKHEIVPSSCDHQVSALMTAQSIDVLEALSRHIYVNTPLEVTKRERSNHEISDRQYAMSIQFSPGDECQVKHNNKTYFGEILHCNKPSAKVFVYVLNKSLDVPFKDIMLVPHKKGSSNRMNINYKQQTKSTTGPVSTSSVMSEEGKSTTGKSFSGTRQSVSTRKPFTQPKTNKVQRAHPYYPNPQLKQKNELKMQSQQVSNQEHETIEPCSSRIEVGSRVSPENPEAGSKLRSISESPVTGNDLLKPQSGRVSPVSSVSIPNVPYSAIPESMNYTHQPCPYTIYTPVSSIGQQERYPPRYGNGGGFSDITVRMNSLMGRANPLDVLNQGNFTSITEAPESEWPILHAGGGGVDNRPQFTGQNVGCTFHLDGPPVNPPHVGVTNNGDIPPSSHLPPFMFATDPLQMLIQEMNPPVQLLKSGSIEGRQQFMFQFARNCLHLYSKYIADPELEDTLNDLLCMQFEDFISSPMTYTEGQLSVATSFTSREESEVTEDRVQTPSDQLQEEDNNYSHQDDDDRGSGTNINPSSTTQSHEATPTSPTESAPPFTKDQSLPPDKLETETREDIPLSEETQLSSQDGIVPPTPLPPHMMTHNPMMIPQYGYPGYPPIWMPPMLPWSYYPMHPFMFPHPPPPLPPPPPAMMHGQYYSPVVTQEEKHEEEEEEEKEEEQLSQNTEKPIVTGSILHLDNAISSIEKPVEPVKLVTTTEGSDRLNEKSKDKTESLDSDTQTTPSVMKYETTPKEQSFTSKLSKSQSSNPGRGRHAAKTKQREMVYRNIDETTNEEVKSNEQNEEHVINPSNETFPRTVSSQEKTSVGQRTSINTKESKNITSSRNTRTSVSEKSGQDQNTAGTRKSGHDHQSTGIRRDQSGGTKGKRFEHTNRRGSYRNTKNSGNRKRGYDPWYHYQWGDHYHSRSMSDEQQLSRQRNTKQNSTRETQQ